MGSVVVGDVVNRGVVAGTNNGGVVHRGVVIDDCVVEGSVVSGVVHDTSSWRDVDCHVHLKKRRG